MKPRNKTIRVFLSSTFEDLIMERDALQQKAFHNLREYCREKGWQFQAVDLRWGITEEATIDQRRIVVSQILQVDFYWNYYYLYYHGH